MVFVSIVWGGAAVAAAASPMIRFGVQGMLTHADLSFKTLQWPAPTWSIVAISCIVMAMRG